MDAQDTDHHGLVLFDCRNVVMAGGGPGDLYEISVYPTRQMGPYAALFEAGARAENLTELQFGLASLSPRWNLSGTYQQVIPRYYSTDSDGGDVQEFLNPWFPDMATLATDIFLKGYQWPFDHDKVQDHGSSLIDILVQNEMVNRGRRVFMDFTRNPAASGDLEAFRLEDLAPEALEYLQKSGATQATPVERLAHMNQPSIDLYAQMGLDLHEEPLEIGVCAQHCNGGFAVDQWWESNVPHLFVIGELAGTHGVKRPGGSALNAGQVGGLRAAQRIAHVYHNKAADGKAFARLVEPVVQAVSDFAAGVKAPGESAFCAAGVRGVIQKRMSRYAGMVRSLDGLEKALEQARVQRQQMTERGLYAPDGGWLDAAEVRELAVAQVAFLTAMRELLARGGGSRGSHLVTDPDGELPHPDLGDEWRYLPENVGLRDEILSVACAPEGDTFAVQAVEPRQAEEREYWFENTWNAFRTADVFRKDPDEQARPYDV
jgi:succinate dehydrogenase/fumarate reductase flavoprotein subunit